MSFKIKDKVYSDNPLLDGIIYNVKLMLNGIILKDDDEADANETAESLAESSIFCAIKRNIAGFSLFDYDAEILAKLGVFDSREITLYANNNDLIPEEYRDDLVKLASEEFLDNYVEKNNYYRKLSGLPDYGEEELYIDSSIITEKYRKYFDFSIPISQYSDYRIGLLERYGFLEKIKSMYPSLDYLNHLGANRIDIFKARIADKFELLYLPEAEELVSNRFKEVLEKNRIIYLKRHYSQAYKFNGDYYDKFMIILIICQSVTDMIVESPEWYIRRDVFDIRTVEYILTANGVKFFSQIPLKYQISLVRILNKIIKYKSCNKNIFDLASIFDFDNINVYKHYLFKERKLDSDGNYITKKKQIHPIPDSTYTEWVDDVENMYNLLFIRTKVDDTYDNYINDNLNRNNYDVVTIDDPWWDGTDDHQTVKEAILEKDFTIQATKYLSFEAEFSISDYEFQIKYFLNMILNINTNIEKLLITVPAIDELSKFEIRDIFILLYLISFNYYEYRNPGYIWNKNRNTSHREVKGYPEPVEEVDIELVDGGPSKPDAEKVSVDGGSSSDDVTINCNGGKAYDNTPIFVNMTGSNSDFCEDHDDSEDIIKPDNVLDFDGSVSFGYDNYSELDGGNFSINYEDIDFYLNGGKARNSYFNYKTGTDYYDDVSEYFKEVSDKSSYPFIDMDTRIYGFNLDADLDYLSKIVGQNHIHFAFYRGYTLEELGVDGFLVPKNKKFVDAAELIKIYKANKKAYDNLVSLMDSADNQYEYDLYEFVFNYLFTTEMSQEYFVKTDGTVPNTYQEYIEDRDPILFEFYEMLMMEDDITTRQYYIGEYVDSVISSLEKYLGEKDLIKHIFYFLPSVNWSSVLEYLALLVNFFKSYKAQFMDIGATLMYDHTLDNRIYMVDNIQYKDIQLDKFDTVNYLDGISEKESQLEPEDYTDISDRVQIYPDYEKKYYDFNGGPSKSRIFYIDIEGNPFTTWNGFSSSSSKLFYADWDGGNYSTEYGDNMNGYTSTEYETVTPSDIDGGLCRLRREDNRIYDLSEEDEEDWDGGNTRHSGNEERYNAGTSNTYEESAFIDITGGDRRDVVGYNNNCHIFYDWDAGTSGYNRILEDINGGPGQERLEYIDYSTYEEWNIDKPENPIEYEPSLDGLKSEGGKSDSNIDEYNYYTDGGGARVNKTHVINVDGIERGSKVRDTDTIRLTKNGNRDFDAKVRISNSINNILQTQYDGLFVDTSGYASAEELLNFNKDFSTLIKDLETRINNVYEGILYAQSYDIEADIRAYIVGAGVDDTLAHLQSQIDTINNKTDGIFIKSVQYTNDAISWIHY